MRRIAYLLIAVLLISLALAACTGSGENDTTAAENSTAEETNTQNSTEGSTSETSADEEEVTYEVNSDGSVDLPFIPW